MSSSSTDLLHAGTSCSHPACRTIDFLPFKCSHCTHSFCTEHWQPTQHDCPKYDPAQYDRIVPQCPFCSKPVNVTPGQDVNAAMERHIDNDCHIFVGKKKRGPVCGNKKCGKSLISPIVCQSCKGQFCPTHRMPDSHTCVTLTPASTPSKQAALSPAGIAAMKRAASSALSSKTNPTPTTSRQNPASSSAPKQNAKPVAGLIKEIKTDRCEPSPSPVLSEKPTIHNITGTPTNNVASVTINTAINNRSNRAPTDRPRNPIPDPTKKWVPAALFASA